MFKNTHNSQAQHTFSSASSVFSGLAFRAWEASMMGMGMKRMVKFLKDKEARGHYSTREITVTRLAHRRQPAAFTNESLMPPAACLLFFKPQICFNKSCSHRHPPPSAQKFFFYRGKKPKTLCCKVTQCNMLRS